MKYDIDLHKTYSAANLILGDDSVSIRGGYGNLTAILGYGNNYVVAGPGYSQVFFGDHTETVYYNDEYTDEWGVEHVNSGSYVQHTFDGYGNNFFKAGADGSYVEAAHGNDTLIGSSGEDVFYGGNGNNFLDGMGGADYLSVGMGNSTILGGGGRDWLTAGIGKQILDGGKGADQLYGGAGTTFVGGKGADTFHFIPDVGMAGKIKMLDFNPFAGDTINLSTLGRFQDDNEEDDIYSMDLDRSHLSFDSKGRLHIDDDNVDLHLVVKGLNSIVYDDATLDVAIANGWLVLHADYVGGKG